MLVVLENIVNMLKVVDGLLEVIGDVYVRYVYGVLYIFNNICGYFFYLVLDIKEFDDVLKYIGCECMIEECLE